LYTEYLKLSFFAMQVLFSTIYALATSGKNTSGAGALGRECSRAESSSEIGFLVIFITGILAA
jgi:hypothetical protein